jgi:fatty-acyl-CoA synthase
MAAVELTSGAEFDAAAFAAFLAEQADLAPKANPRYLRVSPTLPTTGSNKILKRSLQSERWNTGEPVYVCAGRGQPEYRLITAADRQQLEDALLAAGRPVAASQPVSG